MDIAELLAFSVKHDASDLHLSSGLPPMIRVDGDIRRINVPALEHKVVHGLVYDIMNDKQRKDFEEFLETDFSFEIPGLARFRVNAFNQNRGAAAVFRTIPTKVLTLDELGCRPVFKELVQVPRGLILVTGPTGSGKSTTLAALLDLLNDNIDGHSISIEDPIEFVHQDIKSRVSQRELGRDMPTFHAALRHIVRQSPDVIVIGEMRDTESMAIAMRAASTGHRTASASAERAAAASRRERAARSSCEPATASITARERSYSAAGCARTTGTRWPRWNGSKLPP